LIVSANVDLKQVERRAWRWFSQDGLWDMFLGLLLLNMGIGPVLTGTELPLLGIAVILLAFASVVMLAFWAGKKFITARRIGLVRFGPQRQARVKNVRAVLFASALLGAVLFIIGPGISLNWLPKAVAAIPVAAYVWTVQALVVFALGAYFLDVTRFYAYGVLYAVPFPLAIALAESSLPGITGVSAFALAFGMPACVMVLIGAVLFIRFLRRYPVPATGEPQAASERRASLDRPRT
jgi:hypothetical protein